MSVAIFAKNREHLRGALPVVLGAALVWAVFAGVFLGLAPAAILRYLLFQCVIVLLGTAVYKLLDLRGTPLEALAFSYGLGLAALIAVYFCFAPLHANALLPWGALAAVLAAAGTHLALRRRPICAEPDGGELRIALFFCVFALAATSLTLSAAMLPPSLSGMRAYFHDALYGASLTVSAAKGFPMESLQFAGLQQWYHIFSFAYSAVLKLCCGVSAYDATMFYTLVTVAPLGAAAAVLLAKQILGKNRLVWAAGVLALVIPANYGAYYLYQDTIGYPMGLAFALLALSALLRAEAREGCLWNRQHTAALLFLVMCMGAKGPLAATILFGFGVCLLVRLVRTRKAGVLVTGLGYALPFLALYWVFYSRGTAGTMSFSPLYSSLRTPLYYALSGKVPELIARILACLWYTVQTEPVVCAAFVLTLLCLLRLRRLSAAQWFFFGAALFGWFLLNAFKQTGSSEIYFVTVLGSAAWILALQAAQELAEAADRPRARTVLAVVAAALLLPCAVTGALHAAKCYWGNINDSYDMGLSAAIRYSRFADTSSNPISDRGKTITPQEYEAMLWLRDNTSADAVIADGRYLLFDKYFCGGVFSERAFYLEGYGFLTADDTNELTPLKVDRDSVLRAFFESGDEGFLPLLAQRGCDYLILSECVNPGLELSDTYCTEVFRNEHIRIYALQPQEAA